jgi:hypothetical protein
VFAFAGFHAATSPGTEPAAGQRPVTIDLTTDTAGGHTTPSPQKEKPDAAPLKIKEELIAQAGEFSSSTREDMASPDNLDTEADFRLPTELSVRTKVTHITETHRSTSPGGGSSSGGTPSGSLVRYPVFKDFDPNRSSATYVPDWDLTHGSRLVDPTTCYSFVTKAIPPAESLAKSVTPSPVLSDAAFARLAGFQSDFAEICRRWACDAMHAAKAANDQRALMDRIKILEADRDQLKKELWTAKNKHIAEGHEWKAAEERARKLLNSKISELSRLRADFVKKDQELEGKNKELEAANVYQVEVEALRKELEATRHALSLKEADAAQLENSNSRLNDELAAMVAERKWLIKEGIPLVTEAVRDSREMCDAVTEINKYSNLLGYQQGLGEGWRLGGAGKPVSAGQHHDPEAQSKLDMATSAFEDVEFDVVARVVALDDTPVGELADALEKALQSPEREEGGANAPGDNKDDEVEEEAEEEQPDE